MVTIGRSPSELAYLLLMLLAEQRGRATPCCNWKEWAFLKINFACFMSLILDPYILYPFILFNNGQREALEKIQMLCRNIIDWLLTGLQYYSLWREVAAQWEARNWYILDAIAYNQHIIGNFSRQLEGLINLTKGQLKPAGLGLGTSVASSYDI